MKRIALVTDSKYPNLTDDDRLLLQHLSAGRAEGVPVRWDDPTADWSGFDLIVLRSPWDYHKRFAEFSGWIGMLEERRLPLQNPVPVVRWNWNKRYLGGMEAAGALVPHTIFLAKGDRADLAMVLEEHRWQQAVIKPTVSATAFRTWVTSLDTAAVDSDRLNQLLRESEMMIQEFVPEVVSQGEYSFMFFDGVFSHAVLKRAKPGDFRVQSDFGGSYEAVNPSADLIAQATDIAHRFAKDCLYARVDVVERAGKLVTIELELLEPALFLAQHAPAAKAFAAAMLRRI